MKHILIALVLLIAYVVPTPAQDEPSCTTQEYQQALADVADHILTEAQNITDETTALDIALALEVAADSIRAACYRSDFVEADSPGGVIGPIAFSGTFYRAEFTSSTFGSVSITEIEGECDEFNLIAIFEIDGGQDDTVYEFDGNCLALFEIEGEDWTFNIERIR